MFWINPNDGTNRQELLSKDTDPQPNGDWSSMIYNNKFIFELRHGSISNYSITSNTTISDQSWTNIVVTRESSSGEIKLYINGQFDNSIYSSTGLITNSQDIHVGRHAILNSLFYLIIYII